MTPQISIVGIACRYPDADDPEQLWQNVLAGRRAFRRLPEARLDAAYRGGRDDVDRTYLTHAAVLRDWEFDRPAFGVPGTLHRAADHTHWLALETAAAALADAGFPAGDGLDRDGVGVVVGNSLTGEFSRAATLRLRWPYLARAAADALAASGVDPGSATEVIARMERTVKDTFPAPGDETLAGALSNTIAGRICNTFDFHGTGYTVDGACASSLLAVTTACTALVAGDCDIMIAGGVDMSLDPMELVGFSRLGALAGDEMRIYDAAPTGFLPGEGCGMFVLARADQARALGTRVYADIVGWATSSDGAGGLTRPSVGGQLTAVRRAYRRAGLTPGDAGLIEGHGTGTAVGDAVELEALAEARGAGARAAALGSIKANIGHTKAAAGSAGLLKITAAVHRGVLPPTVGCRRPHPLLTVDGVPLRLLDEAEDWQVEDRIAGVSSFGFGGINAHLVIRSAGEPSRPRMSAGDRAWSRRHGVEEIVLTSADGPTALSAALRTLAETADVLSAAEVRDLSVSRWQRHERGAFRAALVARTPAELATAARAAADAAQAWAGEPAMDGRSGWAIGLAKPATVGLLLPGQAAPFQTGAGWWWTSAAGRAAFATLPDTAGTVPDTAIAQPWIVAQTLAGLDWLTEIGVTARMATGHSLGEISALHWAGALDRDTALALATARGRLMTQYGTPATGMVSLSATVAEVAPLLDRTSVVVAAHNAPDRIVVSGQRSELAEVLRRAAECGVDGIALAVSHGFHSPAMRGVEEPLRHMIDTLTIGRPGRSVVSTANGTVLGPHTDPAEVAKLLVAQLTDPVLFVDAVQAVAAEVDLLVEVGPGTVLSRLAPRSAPSVPVVATDVGDPRQHAFATAVLAAWCDADLEPWFAGRSHRRLPDTAPRFVPSACSGDSTASTAVAATLLTDGPAGPDAVPVATEPVEDMVGRVAAHLARALELPVSAVRPDLTLLGDLNLSSLQAMHTVAALAAELGVITPPVPAAIGALTVADLAAALEEQPTGSATDTGSTAAGVAPWIATFVDRWEELPDGPPVPTAWAVEAPDGHLLTRLTSVPGATRRGLAVHVGPTYGAVEIAALLRRVYVERPDAVVVGHDGHPAAAALARSLVAELDRVEIAVVDLAGATAAPDMAALTAAGTDRFREVRIDAAGRALTRVAIPYTPTPTPDPERPLLSSTDVCLVTGGVDGITARCAAALADRTGATMVFLGRTPADDQAVQTALSALRSRIGAHYVAADITEPGQIAAAIAAASAHGPVRGLLHGAALNEPRTIDAVDADTLLATLAPKVQGLRMILDAVPDARLVLAFGSIIGRQGLAGQSEYCIANDWMRHAVEAWADSHPEARTHVLEWSVWSETGMAVRMGVLDGLRARGVTPIEADAGAALALDVLSDPQAPVTLLATSRFVPSATLRVVSGDRRPGLLRYAERTLVGVPGVEVVVEADLTRGDDPYLGDHLVGGIALLPAVAGIEAMAQAAATLGSEGGPHGWAADGLRFTAPISVDDSGTVLRTAALATPSGVEVVLRSSIDAHATDRFRGRVVAAAARPEPGPPVEPPPGPVDVHPFYGDVLFHEGRFRRLLRYDRLTAFRIAAWIDTTEQPGFFGPFHDRTLLLGDPSAFDAVLHVLLPCVPHRLALPVGADRFSTWERPAGPMLVRAVERWHGDGEYRFDVDLHRPDGPVVARWDGLHLRATGPVRDPATLPVELVGPWLSRRLVETGLGGPVEVETPFVDGQVLADVVGADVDGADVDGADVVSARTGEATAVASARLAAARRVLGSEVELGRLTDDGLLELTAGSRRAVTAVRRIGDKAVVAVVATGEGAP